MVSFDYAAAGALATRGANRGNFRAGSTTLTLDKKDLAFIPAILRDTYQFALRQEQMRGNLLDPIVEVDGKQGKSLRRVSQFGNITAYDRIDIGAVIADIYKMLHDLSPWLTGRYYKSHVILVNGTEYNFSSTRAPGLRETDEVQFVNPQPYAKKLEEGWSMQAPRGIYKRVKKAVERKYGKALYLKFTYQSLNLGGMVTRRIGGSGVPLKSPKRVAAIYPTISLRFLSGNTTARQRRVLN